MDRIADREVTSDLPTLHTSSWHVQSFQPGSPSNSAIGSFTIHLHPPGSEGYAAAKATYDQLDYMMRVEGYASHTGSILGGQPRYAGIITGIDKQYGETNSFTLTGVSDLGLANLSRPFPGETLSLGYGSGSAVNASYRQARNYFGTNELGASDTFASFTAANYTSRAGITFGGTAGTWSGTTDAGFNVVSCSTGTDAGLISKVGASAGDNLHRQFVEVTGRLLPSSDANNAGKMGVGLSTDQSATSFVVAYVTAKLNGGTGKYDLNFDAYVRMGGSSSTTFTSILTNVADPEGYIPLTISIQTWGLTASNGDSQRTTITVNGQTMTPSAGFDLGLVTLYPFLYFGAPNTGTATAYMRNLVQQTRYSDDLNPNTAIFKSGSIGTPSHSLARDSNAGPTFLEVWSRVAVVEGWYWRYTPKPYVLGVRGLGTVDLTTDPGTDLGTTRKIVFSRDAGNLVSLQLSANADALASGTATSGVSGTDGGGIAYMRNIPAMTTYGVIDDQTLALTTGAFGSQQRTSHQIISNKVALGANGSKTALVMRDPDTADKWRELDKVMIHDPEMGINYLVARVIGYTFDEGLPTQTLELDQFGEDSIVTVKRLQQGLFKVAETFGNR